LYSATNNPQQFTRASLGITFGTKTIDSLLFVNILATESFTVISITCQNFIRLNATFVLTRLFGLPLIRTGLGSGPRIAYDAS